MAGFKTYEEKKMSVARAAERKAKREQKRVELGLPPRGESKPKKARKKRPLFDRLRDACHVAWSIFVRTRDGRCVLCGTTENLNAHHWVIHAAHSLATRFIPENGVALCYGCHKFKVHIRADAGCLDDIKGYMIPRFLSVERYEEIKALGKGTTKLTTEDLDFRLRYLNECLADLRLSRSGRIEDLGTASAPGATAPEGA